MCFLLFCILAVFVYVYDFATTDYLNLAFVLQDFNRHIRIFTDHYEKKALRDTQTLRAWL